MADAERLGIAIGLEREHGLLAIASDSMAVTTTLQHLVHGRTPRSGIEKKIKDSLLNRDTEIVALWVRSHIGILGNEAADRIAALEGLIGLQDSPKTATLKGMREMSKEARKVSRTPKSTAHDGQSGANMPSWPSRRYAPTEALRRSGYTILAKP